jgi:integrase/recombinase XerD
MNIIIIKRLSADKAKTHYTFQWGRGKGERVATGVFTYTDPINQTGINHNKEALTILDIKKAELLLEFQSGGTGYIAPHKLNQNFFDYYEDYVEKYRREGNRHLENSLKAFKTFFGKSYLLMTDIDESLCEQFRDHLLKTYNGETPANYFFRFRRVLKAATKQGFYKINPATDVKAKTKPGRKKEVLTLEEYKRLMNVYCANHEVKKAAIFCLYTGLRWVDVKTLKWDCIKTKTVKIVQVKTGFELEIPLHNAALEILGDRKNGLVFQLPTQDGANKILDRWVRDAQIDKHITWHCLRHTVSVLLQEGGTNAATVAGILGHTTTKYVERTYQRYNLEKAIAAMENLPAHLDKENADSNTRTVTFRIITGGK